MPPLPQHNPSHNFRLEIQWVREFKDLVTNKELPWTHESATLLQEVFKELSPYGKLALWRVLQSVDAHPILNLTDRLKPQVHALLTAEVNRR